MGLDSKENDADMIRFAITLCFTLLLLGGRGFAQQGSGQDEKILDRGEKLLEEAKSAYEEARSKSSVSAFVDAGFRLEEARIKFIVLQEIGSPDKQKLATDRLRAINQLSKLIHDGKVAISGTPAESEAAKPSDPPAPPPDPTPKGDRKPAKAVDVTARAAVPDAAKQREVEKTVKDLFKDQYAKKAPADRKALSRMMLEQAARSQDDLAALWLLCHEAQDLATQACDVKTAVDAIDATSRVFDVDAMAMKSMAFAALGKSAKSPEECGALASAFLRLVDDLVGADLYDQADKATAAAVQHARKSNDAGLTARATVRAKEITEAKTLYQAMKSVLEALAKTPDDPAANFEMGKFLCFVKGSWDLGLRFLVKGSDAALKSLAEKELSSTVQPADRVASADGWWDLAEKEKSPLRKSQMLAHSRMLYESALPDATALVRAKIEKRMGDAGRATAGAAIDLLSLIDPKQDTVLGAYALNGRSLLCSERTNWARIQIPYSPPDEYDITLVAERTEGVDAVILGLVKSGSQFSVAIDGWNGNGRGLSMLDAKYAIDNETFRQGGLIKNNKPATILYTVHHDGVGVTVDGKKVIDWKGSYSRLSNAGELTVPNPRALFIGCFDSKWVISKLILTPVSGDGKKLR
jgi:hypothetical protein